MGFSYSKVMGEIEEKRGSSEFELNHLQKDALNELCHIASSHAVTALAELTGMTFDIEVPQVHVIPIKDVKYRIAAEKIAVGILIKLEGSFGGCMYILFPKRSAFRLIDVLLCRMPGETSNIETEMEQSVLMETGNIFASAFCDAVADFLKLTLMPSSPSFAFDMVGALLDTALVKIAQAHETNHVILFKYAFQGVEDGFNGSILFFPQPNNLKEVLHILERKILSGT
jgi:chemotaxis protein CheC